MALCKVLVVDTEKNEKPGVTILGALDEAILDEFLISTLLIPIKHPLFAYEFGESARVDAIKILETREIFQNDKRVGKFTDAYKNAFRETNPDIRAQKLTEANKIATEVGIQLQFV